jgi:hypothetical protein
LPTMSDIKNEPIAASSSDDYNITNHNNTHNKSWATRNGLNFASFTAHEDSASGTVELERTMKPRHLNMIAIGGRLVLSRSPRRERDSGQWLQSKDLLRHLGRF